ncbi:MAG: leucine-rich repeat domain-containing protein, partial [Oscillospiraceae bacterium]
FNNGLESIGQEAFTGTKLTTVTIPKTVTSMGYYSYSSYSGSEYPAFYGIDSLKTVIFEEGITAIPKEALYYCKSLSNVVIPEGVKMIGNDAFRGCTGITEIAIPDSVTTINASSFSGCTNLKKVYAVKNTAGYKFAIDNNIEIVELTCLHSETELVVDSVQSCETDGVSRYVCKICGVTVSTERKPATGHNYSTEIVLIKATCQASGIKKVICSKCGDVT